MRIELGPLKLQIPNPPHWLNLVHAVQTLGARPANTPEFAKPQPGDDPRGDLLRGFCAIATLVLAAALHHVWTGWRASLSKSTRTLSSYRRSHSRPQLRALPHSARTACTQMMFAFDERRARNPRVAPPPSPRRRVSSGLTPVAEALCESECDEAAAEAAAAAAAATTTARGGGDVLTRSAISGRRHLVRLLGGGPFSKAPLQVAAGAEECASRSEEPGERSVVRVGETPTTQDTLRV